MTPESVQPTREILFIQRRIEDDKFQGSTIVKPDSTRGEMGIAKVLAVGNKVEGIEAGDSVYLGKLSGLKLVELNGPYFLVHQNEVLAIISE